MDKWIIKTPIQGGLPSVYVERTSWYYVGLGNSSTDQRSARRFYSRREAEETLSRLPTEPGRRIVKLVPKKAKIEAPLAIDLLKQIGELEKKVDDLVRRLHSFAFGTEIAAKAAQQ